MSSASALELEAKEKHRPLAVVVMGVSSCGKSTIGQGIADSLNIPFCDGDAFHPEANIAKMKSGTHIFRQVALFQPPSTTDPNFLLSYRCAIKEYL
jgi:cytidylate kinase